MTDKEPFACIEKRGHGKYPYQVYLNGRLFSATKTEETANEEVAKLDAAFAHLQAKAELADRMWGLIDDIQYCFRNIWALDRAKFELEFMPKMKKVLADYDRLNGDGK